MRRSNNSNNMGGGNSPNGSSSVPAVKPAGSGSGDNERSYLQNAYPPSSPAELSTKQAILADVTSGLGFFPDALIYGTPKGYIQTMYPIAPLKLTKVAVVGGIEYPDTRLATQIRFSSPFRLKKLEGVELSANSSSSICLSEPAKVVAVSSSQEIVVSLNGGALPAAKSVIYCNFNSGITSIEIATTLEATVAIYMFI